MKKDLKSLYETLVKQGLTDKNFEQFKSAAEDEEYRNKVYDVLINRKLYEGERESFNDTYFFEYTPADVKKKPNWMVLLKREVWYPLQIQLWRVDCRMLP